MGYKVTGGHNLNPLNAELNPICHLLALLGAHHILHVSRIKVKSVRDAEKVEHENWLKQKNGYATNNDNIPFFYKDQNITSWLHTFLYNSL